MKKLGLSIVTTALLISSSLEGSSLEKAIENIDVSGTVEYRYDSYGDDGYKTSDGSNSHGSYMNRYKVTLNLSSKVNDDVRFNTRILAAEPDRSNTLSISTNNAGDKNIDVSVEHINFLYTGIKNSSVTIGKQLVLTPWTNRLIPFAGAASGTGVTATTNFNSINVFGGYFNQTNISNFKGGATGFGLSVDGKNYNVSSKNIADTGENLVFGGISTHSSFINSKYTIMNIEDVLTSQFFKLALKSKINDLNINTFLQYSTTSLDDTFNNVTGIQDDDLNFLKFDLKMKKGIYSLGYGYGKTGENGTGIIHRQAESSTIYWFAALDNYFDASYHAANFNIQILPKLNLGIYGLKIDTKQDEKALFATTDAADEKLVYLQSVYKPSKNLQITFRAGQSENDYYTGTSKKFRSEIIYRY